MALYYLCELVALFRCALSLACGITQGKYDRPLIEGRHVFDNLLSERPSDGSHSFMFRKQSRGTIKQSLQTDFTFRPHEPDKMSISK